MRAEVSNPLVKLWQAKTGFEIIATAELTCWRTGELRLFGDGVISLDRPVTSSASSIHNYPAPAFGGEVSRLPGTPVNGGDDRSGVIIERVNLTL